MADFIRQRIEKYNSTNVVLLDHWIDVSEKVALLKRCTVLVLPSIREPWGIVINEAMHFGKPIIVSENVGAANDIVVNGRNGLVVKADDPQALADALETLLGNPQLCRRMGQVSAEIEKTLDISQQVHAFLSAIQLAISSRR